MKMKNKSLIAALMVGLILSTASVYAAAPVISGDANIEYDGRDSGFGDGLTNRIRLVVDDQIDPNIYLHGRFVSKNYISGSERNLPWPATPAGWEHQSIGTGMEQGYIGFKFPGAEIKAGRQPLWLASGMLADINGINGLSAQTSVKGVNVYAFHGQDVFTPNSQTPMAFNAVKITAAEVGTKFGAIDVGATYMKSGDNFYGINASTKVAPNAVAFAQYVKNNDQSADNAGYWVGVKIGNAVKKGDFDYSLSYVKDEPNVNPNSAFYATDGNIIGAKGLRFKAHYNVTQNTTLTFYQDMFKSVSTNAEQRRTDVEYEVRF